MRELFATVRELIREQISETLTPDLFKKTSVQIKESQKYSKNPEESQRIKKHCIVSLSGNIEEFCRYEYYIYFRFFGTNPPSGHKVFCDELREILTLKSKSINW